MPLWFWALLPNVLSTYFGVKGSLSSSVRANGTKWQKSWHGDPLQTKQVVIWGVSPWWGDQGSRMTLMTSGGESGNDRYFIAIQHSKVAMRCSFPGMLCVLHSRGCRLWALNQVARGRCGGGNRVEVLDKDKERSKVGSLAHSSVIMGGWLRWGIQYSLIKSKVAKEIDPTAGKRPSHWLGPELLWTSKVPLPMAVVQRHLAGLHLCCFCCVNKQRAADPEQALLVTANIKNFYLSQGVQFYCFLVTTSF